MSSIQRVNFEPVSSILPVQIRDFGLADKTLIDPLGSNPLIDGEWFNIDSNYKAVPAADRTTTGALASQTSYLVFAEQGRWDIQAMSRKGVPLLFIGGYEGDTRIFDASVALGGGAAITFVGQPLKVATILLGSYKKLGLVGAVAGDGEPIVGRVTKLPANNGGKLRFVTASSI